MRIKENLGLPYMGSKRKIATNIVNYILEHNPNCKYFYDLFGGGGAISFNALQRKQIKEVHYNEFNEGVVNLLLKIRDEGLTQDFYQWIDRDTFISKKDDKDWFGGFLNTCWSFGSNGAKGYMYGKEIEEQKRLLHEIIVNKCDESRLEFKKLIGYEIPKECFTIDNLDKRRLWVLNNINKNSKTTHSISLENLSCLQNLSRLQNLQNLQNLQITNLSYEQVNISTSVNETIVYLDPPYKSTAKYQKELDHEYFLEWCKNSPYKIYVSSYEFDLPCVYEISHNSTLSATNNSKKVVERLFCNQTEFIKNTLF